MATIGTLQRVSASSLAKMLLAEDPTNIAIIDVRDDGKSTPPPQSPLHRVAITYLSSSYPGPS